MVQVRIYKFLEKTKKKRVIEARKMKQSSLLGTSKKNKSYGKNSLI